MRRALTAIGLAYALFASSMGVAAVDSDGVYVVTDAIGCEANEGIDRLAVFSDDQGHIRLFFSHYQYGIVYYEFLANETTETSLSAVSTQTSLWHGLLDVTATGDNLIRIDLTDTVCAEPSIFYAERVDVGDDRDTLAPAGPDSLPLDGTYSTLVRDDEGTLRILTLEEGRAVATYGTESYPRLLNFGAAHIDRESELVELFHFQNDAVKVKWNLGYGLAEDGVLTLVGYGISTTGNIYPVRAARAATPR